jgi:hypothetical protein
VLRPATPIAAAAAALAVAPVLPFKPLECDLEAESDRSPGARAPFTLVRAGVIVVVFGTGSRKSVICRRLLEAEVDAMLFRKTPVVVCRAACAGGRLCAGFEGA